MRHATFAAVVLATLALSACGQKGELQPKTAGTRPVPYGRDKAPPVNTLLALPPQAAPERSVELHTKSEPRDDDPFELPPKG